MVQHAQYQDPGSGSSKCNALVLDVINSNSCAMNKAYLYCIQVPFKLLLDGWYFLIPYGPLCVSLCRCRECDEQHCVPAVDPGDREAGSSHWKSMWETGEVPRRRETLPQDAAVSPFDFSTFSSKSIHSDASLHCRFIISDQVYSPNVGN